MVSVEPPEMMRPLRDELERRADDRERIDSIVVVEALVLVGEQQIEVTRIDVFHGRGQPPAAVDSRIGPQELPVAVDHDGRELDAFAERHGAEGMDPRGEGPGARDRTKSQCNGGGANAPPPPCWSFAHFAASISTEPTPVRPKRSGRYMSST